jgi:hypothetical protein
MLSSFSVHIEILFYSALIPASFAPHIPANSSFHSMKNISGESSGSLLLI